MTAEYDIAIIGGGIAGAGVAAFLGAARRVIILEREDQPGYHTTGRSAAFYAETYGGPDVQPLTTASRGFLTSPSPGFSDYPLLRERGALHVASEGGLIALERMERDFAASGVRIDRLDDAATRAYAPMLRPAWTLSSLFEPGCADMDVGALHQGFLKAARARSHVIRTDAEVARLDRVGAVWRIQLAGGDSISAGVIVNAAGAWADPVARLAGAAALGIRPFRRTIAQITATPPAPEAMPVVIDAGGDWYFKPEAGRYWISPHDEIPDVPCDAQPDEIDIATAIDRFEKATTARVERIDRAWAGLRSFAPDRLPVFGYDAAVPGFFWCAGQGGFGIQTAPAASMLCAALLLETPLPEALTGAGVDPALYTPARFAGAEAAAA